MNLTKISKQQICLQYKSMSLNNEAVNLIVTLVLPVLRNSVCIYPMFHLHIVQQNNC